MSHSKKIKERFYIFVITLPIFGGVIHAVIHGLSHILGIGACP